jgi:hypothetical protein
MRREFAGPGGELAAMTAKFAVRLVFRPIRGLLPEQIY